MSKGGEVENAGDFQEGKLCMVFVFREGALGMKTFFRGLGSGDDRQDGVTGSLQIALWHLHSRLELERINSSRNKRCF